MEVFQPTAIVLQCGADSLQGDRIGSFNLSLDAHAECVRFMKKYRLPMLVTGGGGYLKSNVSRLCFMKSIYDRFTIYCFPLNQKENICSF